MKGDSVMSKKVINVSSGFDLPFSAAIKAGDYIFVSGQIGHIDDKGNRIEGIEAQTRQCLEKMKKILEQAGSSFNDVVKVTIFLRDINDYGKMNETYKKYFLKDAPARSTVVAALVMPEMLVEIDCIAYYPGKIEANSNDKL
jgi:2-iminobutanoate/2-iminopropanoate deaminase